MTARSWDSISGNNIIGDRLENETELIQTKAGDFITGIAHILARVPRPLLLIFKTNDLLRLLDSSLVGSGKDSKGAMLRTMVIMYRYCLETVFRDELQHHKSSYLGLLLTRLKMLTIGIRVWLLQLGATFV